MRKSIVRTLGLIMLGGIAALSITGCKKKEKKTETPELEGYNILWADEFDGNKLNDEIWLREEREIGWTNNELQAYITDEENGFIRDGKFVIKGIETKVGTGTMNSEYTSCKLRNQDAYAFKYGRIEASAKVPEGKGLWPAIWMMPKVQEKYGEWPRCGEIDIMEVLGHETNKAMGTLHYGIPHGSQQGSVTLDGTETFANGFHTYAIEWEPGKIEWFIDGQSYLVVNDWFTSEDGITEKDYPAPFNQDFCIQINLAIGGDWPGNPAPGADYMNNAEFEIDYVRVYQKESYDENVTKPTKSMRKPDATGNYITNQSAKDDSEVGWVMHTQDGGAATCEVIENGYKVIPTANGEQPYSVQLFHTQIPLVNGKTYKISFDIWSDEDRVAREICIDGGAAADWNRHWNTMEYEIGTTAKHEEFTFEMRHKTNPEARLEFNLGLTTSLAPVYITNVRVEEVTA